MNLDKRTSFVTQMHPVTTKRSTTLEVPMYSQFSPRGGGFDMEDIPCNHSPPRTLTIIHTPRYNLMGYELEICCS